MKRQQKTVLNQIGLLRGQMEDLNDDLDPLEARARNKGKPTFPTDVVHWLDSDNRRPHHCNQAVHSHPIISAIIWHRYRTHLAPRREELRELLQALDWNESN
jgi:hypothetical protein